MKREKPVIRVRVDYHSAVRQRSGVAQETVELPAGTSLTEALAYLANRHGPELGEMLLTPEGRVSPGLVLFRNAQLVRHDQRDLGLADGDELKLFPRISGGS